MPVRLAGRLARRGAVAAGRCPIDRTMRAIGNRTAMLLIREAFYGVRRFDELAERVGVSDAVAAQRLKELVSVGVLAKQPYREPGQRTRAEYILTPSGHDLLPVVFAMAQWGSQHLSGGAPTLTHADCGEPVHVLTRCSAGHEVGEADLLVTA